MLLAAAYDAALGIFHLTFWMLLGWPQSLGPSGRINAAVAQVLNLALTFLFFGIAAWLAYAAIGDLDQRATTPVLLGMSAFWTFRALLQPFYFALPVWATAAFIVLFGTGAILHALPVCGIG